ncbi:hypothetical protein J4421_00765 [Candidatus Woesearchaeota archaeon]|nr:hypothetical protein [Candidatus Woesearchaeota archaeon]
MKSLVSYVVTRGGIIAAVGIALASAMPEISHYGTKKTLAEEFQQEMVCYGSGDTSFAAILDYTANCIKRNQIQGCTEIPLEVIADDSHFLVFSSSTAAAKRIPKDICNTFLPVENKQQYF